MAVVLDFESITKGHQGLFSTGRGVRALDGFLLRGAAGEVSGFLSPNGARKSIARTRRELVSAGRDVAANLT